MADKNGLVRVPLGACTCPNTPHPDGDYVELLPKLGMARSLAVIRTSALDDLALAEMSLSVGYARFGIAAWNLVDDSGPMEVNGDNLEVFSQSDPRTIMVAIKGDELYGKEVVAPLVAMASVSSPPTSINEQTSATNGTNSSTKSRKRSKPSLTSITPTEDTATTSALPAGDSSS